MVWTCCLWYCTCPCRGHDWMDVSMKLTHSRKKNTIWLRLGLLFIILVLSCFMLPSIAQQGENRKNIKWEYNLSYQECTYEIQEQGPALFKILIHIYPWKFPGKKTFMRSDQIISGKIDELLTKIHRVICFLKGSTHPVHGVCLDRKATPTLSWVQIFIPVHARIHSWAIVFSSKDDCIWSLVHVIS